MTSVYGSLEARFQIEAWDVLKGLGQDQNLPWMVCGNFSEITYSFEKKMRIVPG